MFDKEFQNQGLNVDDLKLNLTMPYFYFEQYIDYIHEAIKAWNLSLKTFDDYCSFIDGRINKIHKELISE